MRWPVAVALLLLLAGCASPNQSPKSEAEQLPRTEQLDLHEQVAEIFMPAGEPTMLVSLNVTKDMWVRPFMGTDIDPNEPRTGERYDGYWMICPWLQTFGLGPDWSMVVIPFWRENGTLLAATDLVRLDAGFNDASGGACRSSSESGPTRDVIAAPAPFDGELVLLAATRVAGADDFPYEPEGGPKAFRVAIGVGTEVCPGSLPNSLRFCTNAPHVAAQPAVRGGLAIHAAAEVGNALPIYSDSACPACGFQVKDERTAIGPTNAPGNIALHRDGDVEVGFTFAFAGSEGPIRVEWLGQETHLEAACPDYKFNQWIVVGAAHRSAPQLEIDAGVVPPRGAYVTSLEVPIDWTVVAGSIQPVQTGLHTPNPGALVMDC